MRDGVQTSFDATLAALQSPIEEAILEVITNETLDGNEIDLDGDATITDAADILEIEFGERRGRQAITVTFTGCNDRRSGGGDQHRCGGPRHPSTVLGELYDSAYVDDRLPKAGWNWLLVNNDGSRGVHNPDFAFLRDGLRHR